MIHLYGWSETLQNQFSDHTTAGLAPARVLAQHRGLWRLVGEAGEMDAELSGRFHRTAEAGGFPAVGDWTAVSLASGHERALVHHILPRRTAFTRRAAGPAGGEQVVAANIDVAFLVAALNADFNVRRLERYLASAWQSGAEPVIVLTKTDLCPDRSAALDAAEAIAFGTPILPVSALTGEGVEALAAWLAPGRTGVLLGSSGAGKSTLVNTLAGADLMSVGAIREDDARGRHTTSHRELFLLPSGGLILDTPGMRELGLWDAGEGVGAAFADVEALAAACRFVDCGHRAEPGCAVNAARASGALEEDRWQSWLKLQKELAFQEAKENPAVRVERRAKWLKVARANRARTKFDQRRRFEGG